MVQLSRRVAPDHEIPRTTPTCVCAPTQPSQRRPLGTRRPPPPFFFFLNEGRPEVFAAVVGARVPSVTPKMCDRPEEVKTPHTLCAVLQLD